MSGFVHTQKTSLSHTIPKLIFIRAEIDHKDNKVLLNNITTFSNVELETTR